MGTGTKVHIWKSLEVVLVLRSSDRYNIWSRQGQLVIGAHFHQQPMNCGIIFTILCASFFFHELTYIVEASFTYS